jgi:hypothetical protein
MRAEEIVDELERAIENARPIPLTNQVRIDPDAFRQLLEELRQALADGRR